MKAIMTTMAAHHAALSLKLASSAAYETREAPSIEKLSDTIEKIGQAFEAYKAANDQAIKEAKNGGVTPETRAKVDKIDSALSDLTELKSRLEAIETRQARPGATSPLPGEQRQVTPAELEHREAFKKWLRDSKNHRRIEEMEAKEAEYKNSLGPDERRAVDTLTGAAGGYAVPEIIAREITRLGTDISPVRSVARVITAGSPDYKELVDVGGSAFGWVGETDPRPETGTPSLVEVAPTFGMAYAYPKASEESLTDMFFNVEDWLISSAAEAIAKGEGVSFISGNGTKKPTGFLNGATAATKDGARAFGTLEHIASGAAAALPASPDSFLDIVYALRAGYRSNARWMANKLTISGLRKYKDTTGQYLWQPSLVAGQPQTFMGYPVVEAEDMPTVAANALPLAFGDFREGYLIVDLVGTRITRDEVTTPGYVKFYVRRRVGGKLKNSEAIKVLKIAAA